MKTYYVTLKYEAYHGFEVFANNEVDAKHKAEARMESGDWGKETYGNIEMIEMIEMEEL